MQDDATGQHKPNNTIREKKITDNGSSYSHIVKFYIQNQSKEWDALDDWFC